jgi:hypothetical protein
MQDTDVQGIIVCSFNHGQMKQPSTRGLTPCLVLLHFLLSVCSTSGNIYNFYFIVSEYFVYLRGLNTNYSIVTMFILLFKNSDIILKHLVNAKSFINCSLIPFLAGTCFPIHIRISEQQ